MFCSILIFISSVLRLTDDKTERTEKEAAVPRLKTVSPRRLTALKTVSPRSMTALKTVSPCSLTAPKEAGNILWWWLLDTTWLQVTTDAWCHTISTGASFTVLLHNRQTAVQHVSLQSTFNCLSFKNFVLQFPGSTQSMTMCNTLFTYTQRAPSFSFVSSNSSSLPQSCQQRRCNTIICFASYSVNIQYN